MYQPYTKPFSHQLKTFEASKDLDNFAVFWEQGTGKSKLTIDTIGHLWTENKIDAVIIVAPNGVHRNWITDELPVHMSPEIPWEGFAYKGEASTTKWHAAALDTLVRVKGLAILAISYDSWITVAGKKAVWTMMRKRRVMCILDESHRAKTPNAVRTQSLIKGGKHAVVRRILSGTPVLQGPFDLYSQIKFLDEGFWERELDIDSFTAFKAFFGVWEKKWNPLIKRWDKKTKSWVLGGEYDSFVAYQNIPDLAEAIKKISSRVLKDDVLDLPAKLYTKRYYEMFPAQKRLYEQIDKEYMAWLESGELVTAELAIVRMIRLQQVLCGYVPVDGDKEPTELIDPTNNPRLKVLREAMEDVNGKTIIWAQYTKDIDMILEMLRADGRNPVRYDGKMNSDQRQASKDAFKKGDGTDFVANSTMAEGLTLNEAKTTLYFNNSYKYGDRLQTEDRNHRIGQTNHVTYIDFICSGTRDENAIEALVAKREVASAILGDKVKEWISI
nr:SNF2 family helicase protein [Rhizobium phage RHph_TM26]